MTAGGFRASVILDSVSPAGARVTTMEWRYPRFIHSEVMTYRMLSRNTSSSRAIPVKKLISQVLHEPAAPVFWGKSQSGMQAREELTGLSRWAARQLWHGGRYPAILGALAMNLIGVHKQVANRPLEPWMWITLIATGAPVAFDAVWRQRCHPDAQPEFNLLANLARTCYNGSVPVERTLHAPFADHMDNGAISRGLIKRVSTARAARTSYVVHGRIERSMSADIALYRRLHLDSSDDEVPHTSPAEHVLTAHEDPTYRSGNAIGWVQHREEVDPYFIRWTEGVVA
jgi:hypothetical protein